MALVSVSRRLARAVGGLAFGPPVAVVYHPLAYARRPHEAYLRRFGRGPVRALWLGMNPGPFGMVQTGVPFGDVAMVRDWLGVKGPVGPVAGTHPLRPVRGFACARGEVSGRRLWSFARAGWGTPERFFREHFVWNYFAGNAHDSHLFGIAIGPLRKIQSGSQPFVGPQTRKKTRPALGSPAGTQKQSGNQ